MDNGMENHVYDPAGRSLLKLASVLMLLFGILGTVVYALGMGVIAGVAYLTKGVFSVSDDLLGMGLLLAAALTELLAAILGLRAAKRPERAGFGLFFWGVLTLLLALAGMVHIGLRADSLPWWELPAALIMGAFTPIVYLIGAAKLRKGPVYTPEQPADEPRP